MRSTLSRRFMIALLTIISLSLLIAACGGDDEEGTEKPAGNATEQAFLEGMVPHHLSAVEMAEIARKRGEHQEVKRLASGIISTQSAEISQMRRIHRRLFRSELQPDEKAHERLGVAAHESGMDADLADLRSADPFDREFIDMMIPHHQGAIRQARAVLAKADDEEVMRLAEGIVSAQSREIEQMNEWRTQWYGSSSPSGGVPEPESGGGSQADHESQGHE